MIEKIEAIVGNGNVSEKETDLFVYKFDGSNLEGNPKMVVWPSSTEEIAKIAKLANVRNIPVVVRGGGTTTAGCTLADDAILLDLSRMNKILQLNLTERSITVEPAVTIEQINHLLAQYELCFPVVPHTISRVATVGGLIARNALSPSSVRFGRFGDWVMSLEVVDGTGKVFAPSKVNIFVGSEGACGIITKAKLKLTKPITTVSGTWKKCVSYEDLSIGEPSDVLAVEYFDAYCSQLLGLEEKQHLWIEYVFLDKGDIKDQQEILAARKSIAKLYSLLKQNKFTVHTDPYIPPEGMQMFLQFCRKNNIPVYGHFNLGVMHACVRKEHPEMAGKVYNLAQKLKGYPSGESGVGRAWKEHILLSRQQELREHKKFYDPSWILNPGCLL